MEIKRQTYLERLIKRKDNGLAKVITGVRRCGKSFLLFQLFRNKLIESGIPPENIIAVALDDIANQKLRDPTRLYEYIKGLV
ncbi:MAG: AAA family ATPase, partial [Deltaproteobacteria bacterium]|nr:AAA family ATPase [Deltaproteobacteria bacterium]